MQESAQHGFFMYQHIHAGSILPPLEDAIFAWCHIFSTTGWIYYGWLHRTDGKIM